MEKRSVCTPSLSRRTKLFTLYLRQYPANSASRAKVTFFPVKNHATGIRGADSHPGCFTLGFKPAQCLMQVLVGGSQHNHVLCKSRDKIWAVFCLLAYYPSIKLSFVPNKNCQRSGPSQKITNKKRWPDPNRTGACILIIPKSLEVIIKGTRRIRTSALVALCLLEACSLMTDRHEKRLL